MYANTLGESFALLPRTLSAFNLNLEYYNKFLLIYNKLQCYNFILKFKYEWISKVSKFMASYTETDSYTYGLKKINIQITELLKLTY